MKGKKEFEKAKDFKGSIVRLAKELKNYKILIDYKKKWKRFL